MSLITRIVEILSVKPKPAEVSVRDLKVGEFFRWNGDIFIANEFIPDEENGYYDSETGEPNELLVSQSLSTGEYVTFQNELVHRIRLVKIEWEYVR